MPDIAAGACCAPSASLLLQGRCLHFDVVVHNVEDMRWYRVSEQKSTRRHSRKSLVLAQLGNPFSIQPERNLSARGIQNMHLKQVPSIRRDGYGTKYNFVCAAVKRPEDTLGGHIDG